MGQVDPPTDGETLDGLAIRLQDLREHAGLPSYTELTLRIARQRQARGVPEAEARPGRTTVYDAFRVGRRRVDADLVVEIVRALGADDAHIVQWSRSARTAQRNAVPSTTQRNAVPPTAQRNPDQASAVPAEAVESPATARSPRLSLRASLGTRRFSSWQTIAVLVFALGLNFLGRFLVDSLGLPIYLDMVGTATAAVILGPWWGVTVGLLTNVGGAAQAGLLSLLFAPVNVVGALLWGYGVRRFGFGSSIPRSSCST